MQITLVAENGEEHGLLRTLANSCKDNDFKDMSPENKEKIKKQKKEDAKLVKARYVNHQENMHGKLDKPYCKYPGEPIQVWRFLSNKEYEVPLGLVKEVNATFMPKRSEALDRNGAPTTVERTPQKIHEFIPIGF